MDQNINEMIYDMCDNFLVEMPHRVERLKVYSSFAAQNTNPISPLSSFRTIVEPLVCPPFVASAACPI